MKEFFEPSVMIVIFDGRTIVLSGEATDSSSSRVPVNPISDGGGYNW